MAHSKRVRNKRSSKVLQSFMAAAAAIPLVGQGLEASAQTPATAPSVAFKYAHYEEYQGSGQGRMRVNAPMAQVETPLGSRSDLQGFFVYDAMSGASTTYLDSRTGASVQDDRLAGDLRATHYFDQVSLGAGASYSDEDDYTSRSGRIETKWWTEDKNTTIALSAAYNDDDVERSDDPTFHKNRSAQLYLLGVTQVIDERSSFQFNTTASIGDGYLSDPYKNFDVRPESRDSYAALARYIRYIDAADASLHLDYRYYADSWHMQAHTFEFAWYQPVLTNWMVRPRVRYYSQERASFFNTSYPPETPGDFYSTDQRLSDFGGITTGIKFIRDMGSGISADCAFDFQHQRDNFKLGGHGTSEISPFSTWTVLVGLTKRF